LICLKKLTFVSNKGKIDEIEQILGPLNIVKNSTSDTIDYSEEITRKKCISASWKVDGPVIVEDTNLCLNALGECQDHTPNHL